MTGGRFTLLMMSGTLGVVGWTVLFLYYGVGILHLIAAAGAVITFGMMILLAAGQFSRRSLTPAMMPLVMAALLLGILAMVVAVF
jgi:hypothetical protein